MKRLREDLKQTSEPKLMMIKDENNINDKEFREILI